METLELGPLRIPMSDTATTPSSSTFRPSQLYDHLPITPGGRYIRVLDLEYQLSQPDAPLGGTPRPVDLASHPNSVALSYVWGSGSSGAITCNGYALPITDNCREALLSLRRLFGPISIWVDSTCINQANESEKTGQVLLMGEIFSQAQATHIWLGTGDPQLIATIEALNQLSCLGPHPAGFPWNRRNVFRNSILVFISLVRESLAQMVKPEILYPHFYKYLKGNPEILLDAQCLLDCEWFSRAWTFQEALLSPNPVFVCRDKTISWATLKQVRDSTTGGFGKHPALFASFYPRQNGAHPPPTVPCTGY
ncbi:heterokaryon incompatibility protein-domain-containing protein [Hypoxylon crocopeplum]|nr:heterokaryon incompatibility protein-domain-containing protein [Hypoxylon crocopeplum]